MKWDSRQYWLKSKAYQEKAVEVGRDAAERTFWRSLSLEHLLRCSLTKVHPALNADPQNEGLNLLYAFGFTIKGEPRSIPIHSVTARLERILHEFQKPHREFCDFMMLKRNEEVHTCELPFTILKETEWLPHYYEVCDILNRSVGKSLEEYLGREEAQTAAKMIRVRHSEKRAEIKKRVAAEREAFESLPPDEQSERAAAQRALAKGLLPPLTSTRCPACGSEARLVGAIEGTSEPTFKEGSFVVEQRFLASYLKCGACGLELRDIEELLLGDVEPHYTVLAHTDLHEFFDPEDVGDYMNM